jgi:hypothetical protein
MMLECPGDPLLLAVEEEREDQDARGGGRKT